MLAQAMSRISATKPSRISSVGRTSPDEERRAAGCSDAPTPGVGRRELGGERLRDAGQVRRAPASGSRPAAAGLPPRRPALSRVSQSGLGGGGDRQPDLRRPERILVVGRGHADHRRAAGRSARSSGRSRPGRRRSARCQAAWDSTATRAAVAPAVSSSANSRPAPARAPSRRSVLAVTKQPTSRSGRSAPVSSRSGCGRCRGPSKVRFRARHSMQVGVG